MARQRAVVVVFTKVELDSVEGHCATEIHPSPDIAPCIASLARPPLAGLISRCARKVLHEQTRVDCNEYASTEIAQESEEPTDTVTVV